MEKSLDGIKKLNPEEIKKYRKIVLNYIGEKDTAEVDEQKKSNQRAPSSRKVDGLNLNRINRFVVKGKLGLKKFPARSGFPSASPPVQPAEPAVISAGKEELASPLAERARAEGRLKQAIKRQEEERKRIKAEERQFRIKKEQAEKERKEQEKNQKQEKTRLEKERLKQEKIKQAEKRRAEEAKKWEEKIRLEELEKEKKRRVEENSRLEKIKREAEIKMVKQAVKIAKQTAREKKRIKRQKAWRKIKKNFKPKFKNFFSKITRNVVYTISLIVLFLAIAYVIFCLAVLRLKIDNSIISWAANYLPVPAAITSQGIINYSDYKKIENINYLSLGLAEKRKYLAEYVVRRNLSEKYRISNRLTDYDLAVLYVLDKDFNQSGLSRINKINELLKGESGMGPYLKGSIEPLGKYADEYNDGVYYDAKSLAEKFGPTVLELAVGQISNIIPRADGYYIIKRIDDKNNQLGIKYIFIKAQTLDQYVAKKLERIKVFILAN